MNPSELFRLFVGMDWGNAAHQVCVLDAQGEVLGERSVAHTAPAVHELVQWLLDLAAEGPATIAVALEVPRGPLVETLLERGLTVFSLNPKQLDRFRDRYFPAGSKDDRRDAFVLATSLRTDRPCFRAVRRDDPQILRLRDLSRLEEELGGTFHRYAEQLRAQLARYYPQLLALGGPEEPWLWALLQAAPTPAQGRRLSVGCVEKLLRAHRIRRLQAPQVIEQLHAPGFALTPGTVEAASEHALLLLPPLRLLQAQRTEVAARIQSLLDALASDPQPTRQHRDVAILRSLPGVGRVVAATMLAEASQALAARDYHALRAYAGIAPVTRRSGKQKLVRMRYACNARVRNATYHWARVSVQHDAASCAHYHRLRTRGHSHGRALRGVADRLLTVLCAMLNTGTVYDPHRRQAPLPSAA